MPYLVPSTPPNMRVGFLIDTIKNKVFAERKWSQAETNKPNNFDTVFEWKSGRHTKRKFELNKCLGLFGF